MYRDLHKLIFLYTNADEYHKLKKKYKLSVKFYCKNINTILTRQEPSYLNFPKLKDCPPIDWASCAGYLNIVIYLHKHTRPPVANAMDLAGRHGHVKIVEYLHKAGIPFTTWSMGAACRIGHLNIARYMRKSGVPWTWRELDCASYGGQLEIVKYLCKPSILQEIGDIPKNIRVAIGLAKRLCHSEVIEYLEKIEKKYIT